MKALQGRRALVTGGASGIGLATVRRLAGQGVSVVIADLDDEMGEKAAGEVGGFFLHLDVGDPAHIIDGFQRAAAHLDGLDIVFLNAGAGTGEADISRLTDDQYRRAVAVNLDQIVLGAREAVRIMEADKGGAILATSGLAGLFPYPYDPVYCMTKHAVIGMVRGLSASLAPRGITVNAICPAMVETPLMSADAATFLADAGCPLLSPNDVAEAVIQAVVGGGSGDCWICLPERAPTPLGGHLSMQDLEAHVQQMQSALSSPEFPHNKPGA